MLSFYDLIPIIDLSLFITDHRFGFVWSDRIRYKRIIAYVSLVINFGFNMSGAKNVAVYKGNKERLSRIVSSTYLCKFILWLICLIVYFSVISIVPFFKDHYWVYALTFY